MTASTAGTAGTADAVIAYDAAGNLLGRTEAPGGTAAFRFSESGAAAWVVLPEQGEVLRWIDMDFERAGGALSGPPGVVLDGGTAAETEGEYLIIRRADGRQTRLALGGAPLAVERMSENWLHVLLEDRSLAVRVQRNAVDAYRLPEAEP